MVDAKLRAWWSHRQGLDNALAGKTAAEVFESIGWARSVAGVGPYLTLFSRAGLRRPEIDAALAAVEIHELPAARGCTYVLPASDYALGLAVGQSFNEAEMKVARKLGVTDAEIGELRKAVTEALKQGPMDPDSVKKAVGAVARSLGPEGTKKGITTTVPLALGPMQSDGEIRRIPVNGRLDQQRYKYTLWKPNPLAKWKLTQEQSFVELARRFFRWTGGASAGEFQVFSGLGVKASKAALEPLKLEALADGTLMLPEDREAYEKFRPSGKPRYSLVSSLDGLGGLRGSFVDAEGAALSLENHAILDRGAVVGLWEYDTATSAIVWRAFAKPDAALKQAVAKTEAFIREDLGDARSVSLDSPKSRVPKIEALRRAGAA